MSTVPLTKKLGRPKNDELTSRRREEILDVAAQIFAARGYRSTDVQLVADAAEVGKGTVYRYFPTKRELFLATVDREMGRLTTEMEESVESIPDALEQASQVIRAYLAFFEENPHAVELILQERAEFKDRSKPSYYKQRDASAGRWRDLVKRLIDEKRVRPMPVGRILDVINDVLYGTIFTNYFEGRNKSSKQQAENILTIIFNGILTEHERTASE